MFVTESHALTIPLATSERLLSGGMRESQHKRSIKNRDEKNSLYIHLTDNRDHMIEWEKVSFLACDSRYNYRRMKESILIDIFSHTGIINIEDGMKKDACWNVLLPSLRNKFLEKVVA